MTRVPILTLLLRMLKAKLVQLKESMTKKKVIIVKKIIYIFQVKTKSIPKALIIIIIII